MTASAGVVVHGGAQPPIADDAAPAGIELEQSNKKSDPDEFLVEFNKPLDKENPMDWSNREKWAVTNVLSATGFNRILVSTIMAPALSQIGSELDMSPTEAAMSMSIYLLATAFGPLLIGPLSEVYGRQGILHGSNLWFLLWNIVCGFANTKELLIASRFLAGFGASAIYALAGGVLGDVWSREQRGKSLALYLLVPLLASAVGPIVGGFMTNRVSWRWMFWSTSIFQAVLIVFCFTTFRETFAPVILKRRAKKIRKDTGNGRYQTLYERFESDKSIYTLIHRAMTRPLRLLAFHPIVQVYSLISAFYYGLLYIVLSSFADIWIHWYGQSTEISGLHYISLALGEVVGSQVGGPLMDALFRRVQKKTGNEESAPEARLPLIFPFAAIRSVGFLIYAWTLQYRVHWVAVDLGILFATFADQIAGMPLQAYLMDAYPEHIASALAASQFARSLTAFLFPLFTPTMYKAMGYGWGNTMIAFVGLLIGVPAPWFMWKYGARLRAKALSSF